MNHSLRMQLEWYQRHGTQGLTNSQLEDYSWHLEQALQEVRQTIVARRPARPPGPVSGP